MIICKECGYKGVVFFYAGNGVCSRCRGNKYSLDEDYFSKVNMEGVRLLEDKSLRKWILKKRVEWLKSKRKKYQGICTNNLEYAKRWKEKNREYVKAYANIKNRLGYDKDSQIKAVEQFFDSIMKVLGDTFTQRKVINLKTRIENLKKFQFEKIEKKYQKRLKTEVTKWKQANK